MVSLLTERKKKYMRRVCSESVLVLVEREVKENVDNYRSNQEDDGVFCW